MNVRVAICQGKVREMEIFSGSGNCQGFLRTVRELPGNFEKIRFKAINLMNPTSPTN